MARRGDARPERRRTRAPQPFRGPRRGRRAPRHATGRRLTVSRRSRGRFFTVEGLDFTGKTTLVRNLKAMLAGEEPPTSFTREPGGTPAAERIRRVLLDPELEMDPWTEAYLYAAARADHVRNGIMPRLLAGENVVCDRFLDSSVAYQGAGRGLGIQAVRGLNRLAVGDVVPDLTFYLRLGAAERERRARAKGAPLDRIERLGGGFMRRVEAGFEEIAASEPERVRALDASLPPEELAEIVMGAIVKLRGDAG